MRCIGQGLESLKTIYAVMSLPNPVEQKSYDVINNKLSLVMKEVAEESIKRAPVGENSSSPDNLLTVSGDGTWKTRGHSSLIRVCTVIGAETGGKGRLTDSLIDKLAYYYGNAIRCYSTSVKEMRKDIWAVWGHSCSTDDEPMHWFCPTNPNTWCRKLITPFQKLVMVSDGTEFAVGILRDCLMKLDETQRLSMKSGRNTYYDRRKRDVQIKRRRGDEIVMPNTSGYNLRLRRGAKAESRPTNEKRTQEEGRVRASGSGQQQHCQEKKEGANSKRSQSLEVLLGDVSYR
ncbi:uncharacterized protein TNCV_4428681 [Trichonephila clavipes]|nr:uncharacterized protein TNCV_4428681 [Trichonephila clavipes]